MLRALQIPLLAILVLSLAPALAAAQQGSLYLTFDENNPSDTERSTTDFEIITFYLMVDTDQFGGVELHGFEASVNIPPNLLVISRTLVSGAVNLGAGDDNFIVGFQPITWPGPHAMVIYQALVTSPGEGVVTLGPASPTRFPGVYYPSVGFIDAPGWYWPNTGSCPSCETPFLNWMDSQLVINPAPPAPDPEIEYEFTATVTQANVGSGYSVGTDFTGTMKWNPESPVTNPDPFSNGNATEYGPGELTVAGLGTLDGTYDGSGNVRVVNDNFNDGSPNDQFTMELIGSPNGVFLDLTETSGALWNTQSLEQVSPILAPVEQWDYAVLRIGDGLNEMTAVLTSLAPAPEPTLHVKASAPGGGDGLSWGTAFNRLSDALAYADQNFGTNEIWVADGIYFPTSGTDRDATFALQDGMGLYGGFTGTETMRDERDPGLNLTILSGDLGVPEDSADNSYRVVSCVTTDSVPLTATLDGFVVTGANSLGQPETLRGGGVAVHYGTFTGRNLQLVDNQAQLGGGIANQFGSARLENVEIRGNSAVYGGGMDLRYSSSEFANIVVEGNSATYTGGIRLVVATLDMAHATVTNNSASVVYGGMELFVNSVVTCRNSIIWGNTAPSDPNVYLLQSTLDLGHSILEGSGGSGSWDTAFGTDSGGNLDADPMFVSVLSGDVHLQSGSPAIDAGDGSAPMIPPTDLDANPRPSGLTVDMGTYEFQAVPTDAPSSHGLHTSLHAPYPNPFNPRSTVSFSLSAAARASIEIFDVRGRRVQTLLNADMPAGTHEVTWSGRDHQGRGVSSGVYLVVFQSGGVREARRVTLLK